MNIALESERTYSVMDWARQPVSAVSRKADAVGIFEPGNDGGMLHIGATFPSSGKRAPRVMVAPELVSAYGIRAGDEVTGTTVRYRRGLPQLRRVHSINGMEPSCSRRRPSFRELTPVYPTEQLCLSAEGADGEATMHDIDLHAPIAKGARTLVVGEAQSGKTRLLSWLASGIQSNNPEVRLFMLLIGGWPEEFAELRAAVRCGEVVYSEGMEDPRNHVRAAVAVIERAKRLAELREDVVVLIDGLTMLDDACNEVAADRGFGTASWMDTRRLFGSARNVEQGGSLTIVATASERIDDEFLCLMRDASNTVIRLESDPLHIQHGPVVDTLGSWTRHEELVVPPGLVTDPAVAAG